MSLDATIEPLSRIPKTAGFHVLGRVVLLSQLGRGGFGVVYRGLHLDLGAERAVKVFWPKKDLPEARLEEFVKRFQNEARFSAQAGRRVVSVHEIGFAHGCHYFVMDYVAGGSLRQLIEKEPLAPGEACAVVASACIALKKAHKLRIVHRDIKPDNLLLTEDGEVLVADFGIAKSMPAEGATYHHSGVITPGYAPPEQIVGGKLAPSADVYALGVTLGVLLTKDRTFAANLHAEDVVAGEVPADICRVIRRATDPNAKARYQSVVELRDALEPFASTTENLTGAQPRISPHPSEVELAKVRDALAKANQHKIPVPKTPSKPVLKAEGAKGRVKSPGVGRPLLRRRQLMGAVIVVLGIMVAAIGSASGWWEATRSAPALTWAETLDFAPDPQVVASETAREAIRQSGLPWRVRDNSTGLEFLLVPKTKDAETPIYLARTEVSNADYRRLGVAEHRTPSYLGVSLNEDNQPVANVPWEAARDFCARYEMHLPSQNDLRRAAGGPTTQSALAGAANLKDATGSAKFTAWVVPVGLPADGHAVSAPVGSLSVGALGFHDLIGNVREWCSDEVEGGLRMIVGGSWYSERSTGTLREHQSLRPTEFEFDLGFRPARSPHEPNATRPSAKEVRKPAAQPEARRELSWAKPKAGTSWDAKTGLPNEVIETRTGMELVLIPAGSYLRGTTKSEEQSSDDERPQHRVEITRAFYLGRYEVTQAEWRTVMGSNPAYLKGDRRPVETVSWDDCVKYCTDSRAGFRLPTEAEWEYACRAGTTTPFHYGGTISTDQANYDGNGTYGDGQKGRYREKTIDVGSLNRPNAFGLHDMHGNVWEWCADSYDKAGYAKYRNGAKDPFEQESGVSSRVLRGGSWNSRPRGCRSAYRDDLDRSISDLSVGFRVARTP